MRKKLPKTLYAKIETDEDEDIVLFIADDNASVLYEKGKAITVGEYELKRKVRVINRTTVQPI